ncbi:unnamed protein product [Rhodiola kirilowii]
MSDADKALYNPLLLTLFIITPPTFISLRFLQAPYGKHHRPGWGPSLPASLAWFLMESPNSMAHLLPLPSRLPRRSSQILHPHLALPLPLLQSHYPLPPPPPPPALCRALPNLSCFHGFWFQLLERVFTSQIAFESRGL